MYDPGTVLADRYRLEARVGAGGMGEVWRGTDQVLERTVAVKTMHPALLEDPTFAQRFRSEARAMATVEHPGVIVVYDYRADDAGTFLVMAYVDGEPLSRVLHRDGRLPAARVLELVGQAADALHAAHEQGIVHRDVKPANLLLRRNGTLVLTDFGIARTQSGTTLTATGQVPGTWSYVAPELLIGHSATPLSDVYALGVVAYEALVGEHPFVRDNPIASVVARVREPAPEPPAGTPAPVAAILHRALATDPAHRWPSAAALATACRQPTTAADPAAPAASAPQAATVSATVHSAPTVHSTPPPPQHYSDHPYSPAGAALPPTRQQQPPREPRGRWVAVGLVGLASALLYIALILTGALTTTVGFLASPDHLVVWMTLVAAVLLLATRRPAGAGLLAGLGAWAWFEFTYWAVEYRLPDSRWEWTWVWTWRDTAWFGANLLVLLVVLLAVGWLVATRDGRPARQPRYLVVTAVAGLLSVMTTLLAARSLPGEYLPYLLEAPFPDALLLPLVMMVMLGCAAVLPVVLLAAPGRAAARLAAVGWLLGGGQVALTQAFGWLSDDYWESTPLGGVFWFLLLATAATALAATMLPARTARTPS